MHFLICFESVLQLFKPFESMSLMEPTLASLHICTRLLMQSLEKFHEWADRLCLEL